MVVCMHPNSSATLGLAWSIIDFGACNNFLRKVVWKNTRFEMLNSKELMLFFEVAVWE